jgi:hypothetical protein
MQASDQLDDLVSLLYLRANVPSYQTKRALYGFQGEFGRFGDEENRYKLFKEAATP